MTSVRPAQSSYHACHVYRSLADLIATAAGFLAEGLQTGERCWYVGRGNEIPGLRTALRDLGVAVEAAERQGALRIFLPSEVYAAVQPFSPERLMQVFSDGISAALRDGFSGFRAAGEMSWAASAELAEPLLEYEHLVSTLLVNSNARGLCLFDESLMLRQHLDELIAAHPLVATLDGALQPNPASRRRVANHSATDISLLRLVRSVRLQPDFAVPPEGGRDAAP